MDKNNRTKTFMELLVGLEAIEFVGLCKFWGFGSLRKRASPRQLRLITKLPKNLKPVIFQTYLVICSKNFQTYLGLVSANS